MQPLTMDDCRREWMEKVRWTQAKIEELNNHIENNKGLQVIETLRAYRQELRDSISPQAQREFVEIAKMLVQINEARAI